MGRRTRLSMRDEGEHHMTRLFLNQIQADLNGSVLDERYEIYEVRKEGNKDLRNSRIIDANTFEKGIRGVWKKSEDILYLLADEAEPVERAARSEDVSVHRIPSKELSEEDLLQLLFNSIPGFERESSFSNVSGRCFCRMRGTIHGFDALELQIRPGNLICFRVVPFVSISHKDSQEDNSCPEYYLDPFSVIRRTDESGKEDKVFYMAEGSEASASGIPFTDFSRKTGKLRDDPAFMNSIAGILSGTMQVFNPVYEGAAVITGFKDTEVRTEVLPHAEQERDWFLSLLKGKKLALIDKAKTYDTKRLAEQIANILRKYGMEVVFRREESKQEMNLVIIHSAQWYEKNHRPDPYRVRTDCAVQNITIEEFSGKKNSLMISSAALLAYLCDLQIRQDLIEGKGIHVSRQMLELSDGWTFFLPDCFEAEGTQLSLAECHADGSILIRNLRKNEDAKLDSLMTFMHDLGWDRVQCGFMDPDGNAGVIMDSGIYGLPDLSGIYERLEKGDAAMRLRECQAEMMSEAAEMYCFERNGRNCYCAGTLDNDLQPQNLRAARIHEVTVLSGMTVNMETILKLSVRAFIHNGTVSALPYAVRILREYQKMIHA